MFPVLFKYPNSCSRMQEMHSKRPTLCLLLKFCHLLRFLLKTLICQSVGGGGGGILSKDWLTKMGSYPSEWNRQSGFLLHPQIGDGALFL